MADLSLKQLRILKVLRLKSGWTTRKELVDGGAGPKGYSDALGTPSKEIKPETLEQLGYVLRRDPTPPFEYMLTEDGDRILSDYENHYGEVELM